MAAACAKAGRAPEDVKLMAVSKTWGPPALVEAFRAGQRLFGENRVQEWEHKQKDLHSLLGEDVGLIDMHLIGNLQSNKTSKAAWLFSAVDAVDSMKVAQRLHDVCAQVGKVLPILVEVKLSEEESKQGISDYALPGLLRNLQELDGIEVRGRTFAACENCAMRQLRRSKALPCRSFRWACHMTLPWRSKRVRRACA